VWFAWLCYFKVLFDGEFAARVWSAKEPAKLPAPPNPAVPKTKQSEPRISVSMPSAAPAVVTTARETPSAKAAASATTTSALQLLALLQRDGRLVDFLEQDVASFKDEEVGAAARVVHEGCRKVLRAHVKLEPIRTEEEGDKVTLAAGFEPAEVKLTGDVKGSAPYTGTLRHKGWRAKEITLPTPVKGHDPEVIAPAEVEL
jgi:hypothetical protein